MYTLCKICDIIFVVKKMKEKDSIKQKDIEELKLVKDVLIKVSKRVYRDLEFFYQADNKKQRRNIYNREINYDPNNSYGIVCNTLCKIIQEICVNQYGLDIETITCDTDEFGHVDILVTTQSGNKYIINCLSDLERIQLGMKTTRFASEEYFDERYSRIFDKSTISFLSEEENRKIDEDIGYLHLIYMDDFFDMLKSEFDDLKNTLQNDDSLRKSLLGEESQVEDVQSLTSEQLTDLKLRFLLDFCNQRAGLIGHIELIRIYKLLSKQLFSKDERKVINASDCFFDRKEKELKGDVWNTREDRVRFLKLSVEDDVYIVTTADNTYMHMTAKEYEEFKKDNNVHEKNISKTVGIISEAIRNKGIGVNILKHSSVIKKIKELDSMANSISPEELAKITTQIQQANPNCITFELNKCPVFIKLNETQVTIDINGKRSVYSFENDELIEINQNGKFKHTWIDEGKYDVSPYIGDGGCFKNLGNEILE